MASDILASGKSKAAVCAALDITRQTLYEWCDTHDDFKLAINKGMEKCQAVWESIGEDGIKGNYEKFGATPWIFTMKNRFRDDYADNKEEKSTGESFIEKVLSKIAE